MPKLNISNTYLHIVKTPRNTFEVGYYDTYDANKPKNEDILFGTNELHEPNFITEFYPIVQFKDFKEAEYYVFSENLLSTLRKNELTELQDFLNKENAKTEEDEKKFYESYHEILDKGYAFTRVSTNEQGDLSIEHLSGKDIFK